VTIKLCQASHQNQAMEKDHPVPFNIKFQQFGLSDYRHTPENHFHVPTALTSAPVTEITFIPNPTKGLCIPALFGSGASNDR